MVEFRGGLQNQRIRQFVEITDLNVISPANVDSSWVLDSINPKDEDVISRPEKWEFSLRDKPNKIARIYIISEDSISKYGICEIFKKQIFRA